MSAFNTVSLLSFLIFPDRFFMEQVKEWEKKLC